MSLRIRVLAGLAVIAIVLATGATLLAVTTRSRLTTQVDSQLSSAAELVRGFDFERRQPDGRGGSDIRQLSTLYLGYVSSGNVVETLFAPDYTSADAAVPTIDVNTARQAAARGEVMTVASSSSGLRYRLLAVPNGHDDIVLIALPLDAVDSAMTQLITVEVIVMAASGAVLLLVGWWVIHLGVRPVKTMTSVATKIAAGDLSSRAPAARRRTEAGELGTALNTMMGRIEEAFDERAQSQDRLRQFVADASHELRTPVCTIRGYAELYRLGGLDDPVALSDALRRTEQEAIRMGCLIDDLLLLAKLDLGRALERDDVDLGELANDAARDARAAHPQRDIDVRADRPSVVVADDHRLRQVVANPVNNAITYSPPSTPIEIAVAATASDVELRVVDHGPGIDPDLTDTIFDRFVRGDRSWARRSQSSGSGLGLAIVHAIVAAHGGTVRTEPTVGGGATMVVALPSASG